VSAQLASVVDGKALLQVLWVSFAAGLGVTTVFAIGIVGATRTADMRRDGRTAEAIVYGAVALLATAGVAAAVVLAIVVMAHKS
jgi:Na+/melibiose symporter-like transporter